MGAPGVEAEQDRTIRVEDLPEVVMDGSRLRQAKQRMIPFEAVSHVVLLQPHIKYIELASRVDRQRRIKKADKQPKWNEILTNQENRQIFTFSTNSCS